MEIKIRLWLLSFVIIIAFLTSCAEGPVPARFSSGISPEHATDQSKLDTNMTAEGAVDCLKDIINELPGMQVKLDYVKFSENGIYIIGNLRESLLWPFNELKDIPEVVDRGERTRIVFGNTDKNNYQDFNSKSTALKFASALYCLKHLTPQEVETEREKALRTYRNTPIDMILTVKPPFPYWKSCAYYIPVDQRLSLINEVLIEWKTKRLPEILQKSSLNQLRDLEVKLEEYILKVDLGAKEFRDAADTEVREKKSPAAELKLAYIIGHTKLILMAILGSVKNAQVPRAAAGG